MNKKLCKVWNFISRKAVVASTLKELIRKGSKKLNIENGKVSAFLKDGTEIDDDEIFESLPAGVVIYLLTDRDKKPWDGVVSATDEEEHSTNEHSTFSLVTCSCSNTPSTSSTPPCSCSTSSTSFIDTADIPAQTDQSLSWPSAFTIPTSSFSRSLERDLQSGNLSWATKIELLGAICEEIARYTYFPTTIERDIVARQLIKQFPKLKSNIGEGHEGWSSKIYYRLKNLLKKREIFSYKRKVDSENESLKYTPKLKKFKRIPTEEDKMVKDVKKMMRSEMKKEPLKKDHAAIELGLSVCSYDRKKMIESNMPLIKLRSEYPALFTEFGICYDFKTAYKIDLQKTILEGLNTCSPDIINYAVSKNDDLFEIVKDMDNDANTLLVQAIMIIPKLLSEISDYIYKIYPAETKLQQLIKTPITPHLCVIGDPFSSSEIYIVAEKAILVECNEFMEGIVALIGLYFVCNIEYPKQAESTYKFFQAYILKLPCKRLPGKLITFCNALPNLG